MAIHKYHRHPSFILYSQYVRNLIQWLRLNHFSIVQYDDKNDFVTISLAQDNMTRDIVVQFTLSDEAMEICLLYLSFQKTGYSPMQTPLIALLKQQEVRNQQISGSAETTPKSDSGEKMDISDLVHSISEELQLNYAVFLTLSEFYNWDRQLRKSHNPSISGSFDIDLPELARGEVHLLASQSEITRRSEEIVMLLLRRATHTSEHFYAFTPMDKGAFEEQFVRSRAPACGSDDPYSALMSKTNEYLFSLLQYNLGEMFHPFPESSFDILKEIAKNSLDYAYISQSQAFFAVCDSRGDPLVSRDSEFYLFLLFLQDLSSSALPQATGQQMMKVDLFFLSPSRFQSAILKQTRQITLHIPQQEVVQALFKSCFLYSFYHSIVSNGVGNSGELKKFLTNEDCCAGAINNDFSVLLRVLPFLSEEECDAMDAELVRCLKSLNCTVFDDYMIVNCDAYPCFIRVDVTLMLQKSLKKTKVAEEAFCDE